VEQGPTIRKGKKKKKRTEKDQSSKPGDWVSLKVDMGGGEEVTHRSRSYSLEKGDLRPSAIRVDKE